MSSRKSFAIKKIKEEIKEISESPLEGIGITSIDEDPLKYAVNIKLMTGIYEGYCIQLLLTFPENYPDAPPKILIFPGQSFNIEYHKHIFDDKLQENGLHYKKFYFKLLDNNSLGASDNISGWNPDYKISSLLIQVQNYLSNPNLPQILLPDEYKIKLLMKSMDNYKRSFTIKSKIGIVRRVHTWKNPYPEMFDTKKIKQFLTCSILKTNYIDDPSILLGYPIVQAKSKYKSNEIELYPIPEMISYEGYLSEIGKQEEKLDLYFEVNFKSSNNESYNCWVPVYINKRHYEKNKTHILNSFSIIKYGPSGKKEFDFKPEQIFEILPIILNKMIIGMFNGKSEISAPFIRSYFQYVLLFKKLCLEFEEENLAFINKQLSLIFDNNFTIDKKIIPDIGNYLMLLFYSNKENHDKSMKKMWNCLFEEFITRQMFWIFHGTENGSTMKKIVLKSINNKKCFNNFENDKNFKFRDENKFINDLKTFKIFDQIANIISNDKVFLETIFIENDRKKIKDLVNRRINKNFKVIFNDCSKEAKKQIRQIISDKLNFSDYFDVLDNYLYDHCRVSELLKDKNINNIDEIIEYAFQSQKGNSLLIITFFAQKIVDEEGFLEKLESNYGIYFDVDNFIVDMNSKLNEIKKFTDLYRYIESDIYKNKTDLELIIEAYDRAKEKGYLHNYNAKNRNYKVKDNISQSSKRNRRERSRSNSMEKRRDRSREGSRHRSYRSYD